MPDETAPETGPDAAPIFDTGPHPQPLPTAWSADPGWPAATADSGPIPPPAPPPAQPTAQPTVVPATAAGDPGRHDLRRWKLALALLAVWLPAAGVGLALFSWWHSLIDKTPAVYLTLVYVVGCAVVALLLAMVADRPLVSAFAVAVMSAVFASAVAAAPLYGHYYCQVQGPCVAGIIPY